MSVNDPGTQVVATINDYPVTKYNRLFPCTLTQLSPLHKVMVNLVTIDPDSDSDVYAQKNGGLSFTKISCLKLMTAANVVMEGSKPILPASCQRCVQVAQMTRTAPQCGTCKTKDDVAYQVSILVPEPSGGYRRYVATKEINKTNYKGMVEHMAAQCETTALLRALRAGLGIKGSYSKAELQKPFAVALVVLNTTDPELKAALIQRYASSQDSLFGTPTSVAQLPPAVTDTTVTHGYDGVDMETGEIYGAGVELPGDDPPTLDADFGDILPPTSITCQFHGCGAVLANFTDSKGKAWTPESFAGWSKERTGKVLCVNCITRMARESQEQKGA